MKFVCYLGMIALALAGWTQGQSTAAPTQTSGLVLDKTSPEEAVGLLGAPQSERTGELKVQKVGKWLSPVHRRKEFKILSFEKVQGLGKVELAFWEGKLASMHFVLGQTVAARNLSQLYHLEFIPVINSLRDDFLPADYERLKGHVQVAEFPQTYYLVAVSKESFISARVFNSGATPEVPDPLTVHQRSDASTPGLHTRPSPLVGKVTEIQIISRRLEK